MGEFNSKAGTKNDAETAFGHFGIRRVFQRGEQFADFGEGNRFRIVNTSFFGKVHAEK